MPRTLAPRYWAVHLLALACVAVAGGLGLWQYDAWQERREAEATDLTRLEPLPLDQAIGPDDPFPGHLVGRPVTLEGTWVADATVLVSGREHEGRDGYWVVTPLAIPGPGDPAIPIVRGWVADSDPVPEPPEPAAPTADAVGWLQPPEGSGVADDDPTDNVLPQVRIADLVQRVDQDLYGAYAVLTEPTDGLEPADLDQLPEVGRFTALRNLLYAVEWWFFGAFALFVWVRWVYDEAQVDESQSTSAGPHGAPQ